MCVCCRPSLQWGNLFNAAGPSLFSGWPSLQCGRPLTGAISGRQASDWVERKVAHRCTDACPRCSAPAVPVRQKRFVRAKTLREGLYLSHVVCLLSPAVPGLPYLSSCRFPPPPCPLLSLTDGAEHTGQQREHRHSSTASKQASKAWRLGTGESLRAFSKWEHKAKAVVARGV